MATVAKRLYIPRGSRYNVDKQILLTLTPEQLAKSCEILDLLANDETPNDGTCGINYVSFFYSLLIFCRYHMRYLKAYRVPICVQVKLTHKLCEPHICR